ncbi:aspartyl protease family protein [Flavobacterium algicola]|uniref:aspartyl protease family protein n=1 Tax=Flavobacterium algicola TaxID=556529 RepID=UPI001EFE5080|nr:aspartyl protease family protein [Flavobacterium algicola]MCG9793395.1 aspartyl protease family protein [Flavobacterium algicola]
MKISICIVVVTMIVGCATRKSPPILKTNAKVISIQDGNTFHENGWTVSPEVAVDEFVTSKSLVEKKVSFISDIDTLTFNVIPNRAYDFIIQYNQQKAFTRINTDTLKEASIAEKKILIYYYDDENRESLTDTIPFILGDDQRIHLKGSINNSSALDLLFDTGANAVAIKSNLIGNKVTVDLDGKSENEGSDGIDTIQTSSSNKLKIKNLNWEDVELLSIDYQDPNFDAVLGWIAFENKIVEIDYDHKILILHKSMQTTPKDYSKVETKMIGGVPFIKGLITTENKTSSGWFEYDSGYTGSFSVSQKFASENDLTRALKIVGTSISSGSSGAKMTAHDYILPKLKFGELELIDIPISIEEKDPDGVENNDLLGNSLLKRFNTIIDFQNFQIYLQPNNLFNSKY